MSSLRARSLKDIFTFTRASTATYCNAAGVLATAAIDEPRFDCDPLTRAPRGLLIEEYRTNGLLRSQEFNDTNWIKTRCATYGDAVLAPNGTASAHALVEDSTATDTHYIYQSVAKASASEVQMYALSLWAKARERTRVNLVAQGTSGLVNSVSCVFNLAAGTAGSVTTAGQYDNAYARIEAWPNGWYRCGLVFRVNNDAQAGVSCVILLADAAGNVNYSGDGASGLYLFGAQLEKGFCITSYIPTEGGAVERNFDECAALSTQPWLNAAEGTLFAEYSVPWSPVAPDVSGHYLAQLDDGTVENRHLLYLSAGAHGGYTATGNVQQAALAAAAVVADATNRAAYAWSSAGAVLAVTGASSLLTDSSVALPETLTQLRVGAFDAYYGQVLNGHIRKLKFYPRRLTDNELRALVA